MVYEVVCTKNYLDVGLLIEKTYHSKPKRVLARASTYSSDHEYGGVETLTWVSTGVFLSKEEWKNVSCDRGTEEILRELGIEKNKKRDNKIKESLNMTNIKQVVDNRAFEKKYNVEWYLSNGNIQTTSAIMVSIENGYIFFRYPSGGIFIIKDDAIRSLECLE